MEWGTTNIPGDVAMVGWSLNFADHQRKELLEIYVSGGRVLKFIFKLVSHVYQLNSGILGSSRLSLNKSITGDINFLTLGLELD